MTWRAAMTRCVDYGAYQGKNEGRDSREEGIYKSCVEAPQSRAMIANL